MLVSHHRVSVQDVTTRECSETAHVDPLPVTEYLDSVQLDYGGKCDQRNLDQIQQVRELLESCLHVP